MDHILRPRTSATISLADIGSLEPARTVTAASRSETFLGFFSLAGLGAFGALAGLAALAALGLPPFLGLVATAASGPAIVGPGLVLSGTATSAGTGGVVAAGAGASIASIRALISARAALRARSVRAGSDFLFLPFIVISNRGVRNPAGHSGESRPVARFPARGRGAYWLQSVSMTRKYSRMSPPAPG